MTTLLNKRITRAVVVSLVLVMTLGVSVFAGGPLFVIDGRAILWAARNVIGGPLNTQTVAVDRFGLA